MGGITKVIQFIKNIVKFLTRKDCVINWYGLVFESGTYPRFVYEQLKKNNISDIRVLLEKDGKIVEETHKLDPFEDYPSLVFVVNK